jgi:hypothetical protein
MRLQPIIDQLADLGFRMVDGVAGLAEVDESLRTLPAAFISPSDETAAANRLSSGAIDQRVVASFSVIIVITSASRAAGRVNEALYELSEAVKDALAGWTHPDMSGPTEYRRGRLLAIRPGQIWWGVDFAAPYHVRKTA